MGRKQAFAFALFSLGGNAVVAFSPSAPNGRVDMVSTKGELDDTARTGSPSDIFSSTTNRRDVMFKAMGMLALPTLLGGSLPAYADVSDGNALPQGAAQFGRVVRAKTDLISVSKRVATGAAEMDKAEWENIGQFLRKVYGVGEDMKAIASGFDAEKKQKAAGLIDDLKKYSKAADAPTGSQNGPEFLAYAKKLSSILDEFLDLLSDVPDEL